MSRRNKKRFFIFILLIGFLNILAFFKTRPSDSKQEPSADLVIYSPNTDSLLSTIIPPFEQMYQVKIDLVQDSTGNLFDRLKMKELDQQADIIFGGSTLWYEANKSLFAPYECNGSKNIPEIYRSKESFYTPYSMEGNVLLVNKQLSKGVKINSYEDLLQPSLIGKIGVSDPQLASVAFSQLINILIAKGGYEEPQSWQYVQNLFIHQRPHIYNETSEVNQALENGHLAVGLSTEAVSYQLIDKGAPLEIIYPQEGVLYLPAGVGVLRESVNKDLAQIFIDYLLSPSVQKTLAETLYQRPVIDEYADTSILKDLEDIHLLNYETGDILIKQDDIREKYQQLIHN